MRVRGRDAIAKTATVMSTASLGLPAVGDTWYALACDCFGVPASVVSEFARSAQWSFLDSERIFFVCIYCFLFRYNESER